MYYRRAMFYCAFSVGKRFSAKGIHKEIAPVYGGEVCHVKRFTTGRKCFADDEHIETEVRK
jgi:hypothetical protein